MAMHESRPDELTHEILREPDAEALSTTNVGRFLTWLRARGWPGELTYQEALAVVDHRGQRLLAGHLGVLRRCGDR